MIETIYQRLSTKEKTIHKMVQDPTIHYIQMIFNNNEGLPKHTTNATVYMSVLTGTLSLQLEDQDVHEYSSGMVVKIPEGTHMLATNNHQELLELIVIKSFN